MKTLRITCDFTSPADGHDGPAFGRIDRVVQQLTGLSRAGVRGLFDHDCVHINGGLCTDPAAAVRTGDHVQVTYDPHRRYREKPRAWRDPAFDIVFEDQHLLVVNKSAHVLTVPSNSRQSNTLIHALERYLNTSPTQRSSRRKSSGPARIFVVHRLDRGVSGLLVFAKSQSIASRLKDQFAAHKPKRTYIAIVAGTLARKSGTFRSYLATDANLNRYSTKRTDQGELAITHYQVIEPSRTDGKPRRGTESSTDTGRGVSVVEVHLETGRRNQIRVHFAEAGHPVLGDPRYPRESPGSARHPLWTARRLALHALRLQLTHPVNGELMRFEAPLPAEFEPLMGR